MYQIEVGNVYVHPEIVEDVTLLNDLIIPESFDSVLVNGTHYFVRQNQVHHAYTISFTLISNN